VSLETGEVVGAGNVDSRHAVQHNDNEIWQTWSVKQLLCHPVALRGPEESEDLISPSAMRELAGIARTSPGRR
jgi:hypothetical protein